MAWDKGFNFRATSGYVSDGANETYVAADAYPTNRNTVVFGWTSDPGDSARNRNDTLDRRLAGINQIANGSQKVFQVDLPATGAYDIYLALGDTLDQAAEYCQVLDNTSAILTINDADGITGGNYYDAAGSLYSAANWPTSNTAVRYTFASTTLNVKVGTSGAASGNSTIAHLFISQVSTKVPVFMHHYSQQG